MRTHAIIFAMGLLAGCAAIADGPSRESEQGRHDGVSCGDYPAKDCNPYAVFDFIANHPADTVGGVVGCSECLVDLVDAGIAVVDSGPAALVDAGALLGYVVTAAHCRECVSFAEESGIAESLDCALEPCQYDPAVRDQECQQLCSPSFGFVAPGSTACLCTDSQAEYDCRMICDHGYQINADCWCEAVPPPPPPPECSDTGDGYACSSDPDTGQDRACCGGTCVIWECSACDVGNPYCG